MKAIILALILFSLPVAAGAAPITFLLDGSLGDSGSLAGHLTYDATESPIAYDVRNLWAHGGNASYALTDYDLTVQDSFSGLIENIHYSSALAGQTAEFCVGYCIFGSPGVMTLRFFDSLGTLQLGWTATGSLAEWGTFLPQGSNLLFGPPITLILQYASALHPAGWEEYFTHSVFAGVTQANITALNPPLSVPEPIQAVPEPPTWLLLLSGLLVVGALIRRSI